MPEGRASRRSPPGNRASEDVLPPILLPFTIHATAGTSPAPETERSLGHRLGLWWEEVGDSEGGVVVTGIKPGGAAAASQALAVGDTIVEVDGNPLRGLADIVRRVTAESADSVRLTVRSAADGSLRAATIRVASVAPTPAAGSTPPTAHVPTTDPTTSIQRYIECILCNPLQREVTHPGVAADADFGCLGADLEFGIQSVGLSEMRNAIVQGERRLDDVQVSSLDLEVREAGETHVRPGVRVEAKLAASGAAVNIDLEIHELTSKRRSNRLRRRSRQGEESSR
jgi:membrane-associated protease RseP (regulator of RpoE activity)